MFILLSASLFIIRRFNISHNRFRRFCILRSIVIFLLVIKAVLPSITQNYIAINSASALPVTTLWLFSSFSISSRIQNGETYLSKGVSPFPSKSKKCTDCEPRSFSHTAFSDFPFLIFYPINKLSSIR